MLQDLRYALRQLRRTPVFTVVAVLTFGLGIGANAAVFSVMNAVVLRLLPVQDPERLVFLHTSGMPNNGSQTGFGDTSLTLTVYEQLRAERRAFAELMAFVPLDTSQTAVRHGDQAETARADMVSGNFFSGLGVRMAIGRGLTEEDEASRAPNAVIGYGYWTRRFGRSPSAVGSTLFVKGVPFTIVGVATAAFAGVNSNNATDVWIPIQERPELKPWGRPPEGGNTFHGSPNWWFLLTVGRLAPGVSAEQALAIAQPVFQRAAYAPTGVVPKEETPPALSFTSARGIQGLRDSYRQPLVTLMAMVALVLLIACGNVAMLLAARNSARMREFSLRTALGGSRGRLFRQLLTESLLLVAMGSALGWLFASWATRALAAWSNFDVTLQPDWNVVAFTLALSTAAAIAFGLAPLRTARRAPPALVLRATATNVTADAARMLGARIVLAGQIALCVVLLVGAGLLVRSLQNLSAADLGLRTSGLLVFGVTPPPEVRSTEAATRFYQSLTDRIRALPGVEAVTLMGNRIGSGWSNNTVAFIDGVRAGDRGEMRWNNVGPDFFRVLGIPITLGRDFTDTDLRGSGSIVIVNETFVQQYMAGRHPLGRQVARSNAPDARQYTIVGVAANSRYTGVRETDRPMAYFLYTQVASISGMHFEVRAAGDPSRLLPSLRRVVSEQSPDVPLLMPMTQEEQFARSFSQERLFSRLATAFGLLAAILVATGLYGTLSYRVSRRTSEIGVRIALGAQRSQVMWMVLRDTLIVCAAGIAVGLPLSFFGARLLQSMLFGLSAGDPLSFTAALAGVVAVALVASLVPARRAVSIDPTAALRAE